MNRLSTAGFVPPSGYIGFPSFVLAKGRSGQLSTILWGATGTVSFCATRPVGVLFCPAPPRPAAPPCAAPTRTARGMFGFWTRQVPYGGITLTQYYGNNGANCLPQFLVFVSIVSMTVFHRNSWRRQFFRFPTKWSCNRPGATNQPLGNHILDSTGRGMRING